MIRNVLIVATISLGFSAQARIWTDVKGNYIEADLVYATENTATLGVGKARKTLPITNFSQADQEYIISRLDSFKPTGSYVDKRETNVDMSAKANEAMAAIQAEKRAIAEAKSARVEAARESFRRRMAANAAARKARTVVSRRGGGGGC